MLQYFEGYCTGRNVFVAIGTQASQPPHLTAQAIVRLAHDQMFPVFISLDVSNGSIYGLTWNAVSSLDEIL
jgi:hypothetical protein